MNVPSHLMYTRDHEWLRMEGNVAVIGITDHAQDALGDIVFVELPQVGTVVTAGEPFGVVESTKTTSELFAPVSGKVIAVNAQLTATPELLNSEFYGDAWLIKVDASDPGEAEKLLSAEAYAALLSELG